MKKNILYLGVGLAVVFAAACTRVRKSNEGQEAVPEFVLTYAENQAEDYPTTQGAYKFKELVYERTGGKIEIQVNTSGILGDERTVIEQLQFGGVDFARVSLSPLAEFVPKLNILQMPYLYTNREHMWKVLDGPIGDDFMNSFGDSSLVPLSWYDAGARSFYNSSRPIESLKDMEGMKIRVQESALAMDTIEALGAVPVPMTYGDVYSAIQTGKINGAENNWPSYESTGHHEVARYFTRDEHTRVPEIQLVSRSTWDKLPAEYRQIIGQCARESALYERDLWADREQLSEERTRKAGCVVTELPLKEKTRFREAVAPLYKKYCSDYEDIIKAIADTGKEHSQ
ncbi:TRAP transporter substrate-binding protein [Lacrimispora sp.]|uniref:TRAP transporter substrate-binding protein n=1 Tax=Lacrimispora sp. TaxID=2719234 RepID=UPI00345F857E